MNRDYTFKNTNTISFMYDSSIENIVRRYDMTLQAASKVILPLLNSTSFFLKLRSEEYLDNTMKFVFEAVSSNQILTLTILNDIFIIEHQDEMYVYSFDWDRNNLYLRLESFTKKLKEKEICQRIDSHYLYIDITFANRIFRLEIPYDINYYLDTNYFNPLKETTNITDLMKIYRERFLVGQTDYEKTLESAVSIFMKEEGKDILLDKLTFRGGLVEKYYLSSLKNQVQISIKGNINEESEIIIRNYNNPEDISLDEEIRNLYYQSRRLELNFGQKKAFIISRERKKE